jgi:ankyrin repeat protein
MFESEADVQRAETRPNQKQIMYEQTKEREANKRNEQTDLHSTRISTARGGAHASSPTWMVRRLRHSVAVDPRERAEMNALLVATDQKDAPRVRAMIEGAANPDAVVDKAHVPQMPRRGGRDWAKFDGWSALLMACFYADLTIAKLLLEAGASTELRVHESGSTALMFIASASAQLPARGIPAAELLLDCGSEVNAVDDDGWTPLMIAANNGCTAMVETLLARGANVHMKNTDGNNRRDDGVDGTAAQG